MDDIRIEELVAEKDKAKRELINSLGKDDKVTKVAKKKPVFHAALAADTSEEVKMPGVGVEPIATRTRRRSSMRESGDGDNDHGGN